MLPAPPPLPTWSVAGRDRRAARVGVAAGQDQCSRAYLGQATGTANNPAKSWIIGATENQRSVVEHIFHDASGTTAVADLERAGRDRRATAIGVGAGQG